MIFSIRQWCLKYCSNLDTLVLDTLIELDVKLKKSKQIEFVYESSGISGKWETEGLLWNNIQLIAS